MKRVTGGQIRKTISITKGEILEVVEDDRFLMCPGHEYLMTCEYYWHHVSIILIVSLFLVVLIGYQIRFDTYLYRTFSYYRLWTS